VWKPLQHFGCNELGRLKAADIKKLLGNGKYVFVPIPKNVTDKTEGNAWFKALSEFREKVKATLVDSQSALQDKRLHSNRSSGKSLSIQPNDQAVTPIHQRSHLSSKSSGNGKNIVKVNSVKEMEKAVEKMKPKGK